MIHCNITILSKSCITILKFRYYRDLMLSSKQIINIILIVWIDQNNRNHIPPMLIFSRVNLKHIIRGDQQFQLKKPMYLASPSDIYLLTTRIILQNFLRFLLLVLFYLLMRTNNIILSCIV